MLGFVFAVLLLLFGRPLFALGCAFVTVVFAGIAAIAQTAPSVLVGGTGPGYLVGSAVLVLPGLLPKLFPPDARHHRDSTRTSSGDPGH